MAPYAGSCFAAEDTIIRIKNPCGEARANEGFDSITLRRFRHDPIVPHGVAFFSEKGITAGIKAVSATLREIAS